MRLGDLLLEEKLVSREGLEEALESQVINGGRLGTNLVEMGLVKEHDLARLLGRQHNVAFASGVMTPDAQALRLIEPNFADEKDVLPMRADATRLSIAVINPRDLATLDTVGFQTGRRIVPVVIPEFRMNQLLRRHCKAFRNMRAIDLNTIRPSKTLGTKQDGPKPMDAAELINEEDFQSLYAEAVTGGAQGSEQEQILEGVIVDDDSITGPRAIAPEILGAAAGSPRVEETVASPLTFAEAQKHLAQSTNREDIARTVLRFAISKWKRALLLSVQGDFVVGWQGLGEGVRIKAIQRIGVALRAGTTFKLVRDTRAHYVGSMRRDAGTAYFYKLLGAGHPQTAVLLPLLVRQKVVHILYVDDGANELTSPDIGELLILSQSVARSYEVLMKKRKSA